MGKDHDPISTGIPVLKFQDPEIVPGRLKDYADGMQLVASEVGVCSGTKAAGRSTEAAHAECRGKA